MFTEDPSESLEQELYDIPEYKIKFAPFYSCKNQTNFEDWETWLYSCLAGVSSLSIVLLNILIYVAFFKREKLRQLPCARIIWHVMVPSDLLIGSVALPLMLAYYICGGGFPLPRIFCDPWIFIDYLGSNVSKYSVALVALERFIAIGWPHRHAKLIKARGEKVMVVLIWVVISAWLLGEMVLWPHITGFRASEPEGVCDHPLYYNAIVNVIHRIFAWYLPFITTVVCYIGLSVLVIRSMRSVNKYLETNEQKKRLNNIQKTFRITTCVVVSFGICWFPYQVIEVLRAVKIVTPGKYSSIEISIFVGFLNSLVNPISYFFMDVRFRRAVRYLFNCESKTRTNQTLNSEMRTQQIRAVDKVD